MPACPEGAPPTRRTSLDQSISVESLLRRRYSAPDMPDPQNTFMRARTTDVAETS